MKNITSDLTALEVGTAYALKEESAATILTELPAVELPLDMNDATAFKFEYCNKRFTLINIGCGSIAVRTN
ncbi:hypothetical protein DNI05_21105 [Salmonella enterica subsp. enterica serovar Newport]|nr:hypothetical protein [Salmonella enterica subsp. enterica serovar Newport]